MARLVRHLAYLMCGAIVVALAAVGSGTVALAAGGTPTTTSVTPAPSPGTTGPITYSVTVTDTTNAGVPTGSVTVSDGASGTCTIASLTAGDVNYTSTGSCVIDEPAGDYAITATYSGDTTYTGSVGLNTESVTAATPTVTVTPTPSPATTGPVTYDVTVAGVTGAVAPTGSVAVSDGASGTCAISSLTPGTNSGSGSCVIDEAAATSAYSITASFTSGDDNYSDANGTNTETVTPATPTVALTYLPDPATYGPIVYTATVTVPAGAVAPTGTVVVTATSPTEQVFTCTVTSLSSGTGNCTIDQPAQTPTSYAVTAVYSGDSNYNTANLAKPVSQSVGPATVTVGLSPSANPATTVGATASVVYTVTVTGVSGDAVPTGGAVVTDGTNECSINALKNGVGSCTLKEAAGSYSVTATTTGDGNYLSGTSSPVSEVVNQGTAGVKTTTALAVKGSPAKPKGKVTLTATVAPSPKGTTPTGSVEFFFGTTLEKTVTLSGGKAAYVYTVPAGHKAATITVKAVYEPTTGSNWLTSSKTGSFKIT